MIDANTSNGSGCHARIASRNGGNQPCAILQLLWTAQHGYQTSTSSNPWYYYYPGYGYAYNYPTYNYYAGSPFPAPRAFWDPYVALRPYSDNAGPKASGHGSP